MEIIFASNNADKVREISHILGEEIRIISLGQAGIYTDIPEPYHTLEKNAEGKARFVYEKTGKWCFADDTGLEVEALDGAPGVYSARFAGEEKSSTANMKKLLDLLKGKENRRARFRTVIALIINNETLLFEGTVEGEITHEPHGSMGFGYDPVFRPNGYKKTFAQMSLDEKNLISHRKRAIQKLADFIGRMKK